LTSLLIRQERIPASALKLVRPQEGLTYRAAPLEEKALERFYLAAAFLLRIFAKRLFSSVVRNPFLTT
jgi:hypothetical protein